MEDRTLLKQNVVPTGQGSGSRTQELQHKLNAKIRPKFQANNQQGPPNDANKG